MTTPPCLRIVKLYSNVSCGMRAGGTKVRLLMYVGESAQESAKAVWKSVQVLAKAGPLTQRVWQNNGVQFLPAHTCATPTSPPPDCHEDLDT